MEDYLVVQKWLPGNRSRVEAEGFSRLFVKALVSIGEKGKWDDIWNNKSQNGRGWRYVYEQLHPSDHRQVKALAFIKQMNTLRNSNRRFAVTLDRLMMAGARRNNMYWQESKFKKLNANLRNALLYQPASANQNRIYLNDTMIPNYFNTNQTSPIFPSESASITLESAKSSIDLRLDNNQKIESATPMSISVPSANNVSSTSASVSANIAPVASNPASPSTLNSTINNLSYTSVLTAVKEYFGPGELSLAGNKVKIASQLGMVV